MVTGIPTVKTSRSNEAYRVLKGMILRGVLAPGAEFTELQASELVGSSRTPVREALARLRHDRLIVLLAARRYAIAPISMGDVHNLFDVRRLIESETTRLAVGRVDGEQLRSLDQLCRSTYDPADSESIQGFLQANKEFHQALARASGNPRLVDLLIPLLDEMERLLYLGLQHSDRGAAIIHEHRSLIAALEAGETAAAVQEIHTQLNDAQEMVTQAFLDGAFDPKLMTIDLHGGARS
ncbi:GntR family transcriptional regulator [Ferrimicrobium sp.]|uniref:GntR family transcriptional regulator n=1 Tax=Ferrimicrobium sp. TaxID=2926050 RepID=UPI00261FF6BB|nr:GntR family transcriptional regulator [Ferrimicrobium sp.]